MENSLSYQESVNNGGLSWHKPQVQKLTINEDTGGFVQNLQSATSDFAGEE